MNAVTAWWAFNGGWSPTNGGWVRYKRNSDPPLAGSNVTVSGDFICAASAEIALAFDRAATGNPSAPDTRKP